MQLEQRYLSILHRWLWLLVLATLIAALASYIYTRFEPPVYQATARLIVGPGIDSPSPDLNALRAGGQLMQTYAELPTTGPFLQSLIDDLNLTMSREALENAVEVVSNQETQILRITARHRDPAVAVAIANKTAERLVEMSPSGTGSPTIALKEQMRVQATKIEDNILEIEADIARLEREFPTAPDAESQGMIMDQISQARNRLTDAHRTLAVLYESLQEAETNQVKIIEPATGTVPVVSQEWLKIFVGGLAGLVLSLIVVFAYELMYDSVQSVEDLERITDAPVLGAIAGHRKLPGTGEEAMAVQALPTSQAAENYRTLGTRLLFSQEPRPLQTVLLSGVQVSEDVGEIAANLAVILAQTGSRIILVDANLHHPTLGNLFGIDDRCGLTDVLTNQAQVPELATIDWAPGLSVLPSGPVTYSSFALLVSPRMVNLLEQLKSQADIVLITASPLLSFADSLFLASTVDGAIVVTRSGKTRRESIREATESLRSVGAPILGTVLNNSRQGHVNLPDVSGNAQPRRGRQPQIGTPGSPRRRLSGFATDSSQD